MYEQAIISALMNEPMTRPRIFAKIFEKDFNNSLAKDAFTTIKQLYEDGTPIDDDETMTRLYVKYASLFENLQPIHFSDAINGLIYKSITGNCREHVQSLLDDINNQKATLPEIQERIKDTIEKSVDYRVNTNKLGIDEVSRKAYEMITRQLNVVPFGIREIDNKACMELGTVSIIGARPRVGKTSLALSCIRNQLKMRQGVGIWCGEMSPEDLFLRIISQEINIPFLNLKLNYKYLSDLEKEKFHQARKELSEMNLHIKTGSATTTELKAWATDICKTDGVNVVWCDYLQRMQPRFNNASRREQVSDISREIHKIAQELNVPFAVLAQLNRQAENAFPEIDHLEECSSIEQDAHLVLLMDRPKVNKPNVIKRGYYAETFDPDTGTEKIKLDEMMEDQDLTAIVVAKNRNGSTCVRFLQFYPEAMKFGNPLFDFKRKGEMN